MITILITVTYFFEIKDTTVRFLLIVISIVIAFVIQNKVERRASKKTIIKLTSKVLTIDSQQRFSIDEVRKYQIRISSRNFPAIIIHLKDGKKHVIQCAEKYNFNFTDFVTHFEKLVET